MKVGLSFSTVGHAALIAWGVIALPGATALHVPPQDSLPVDIMTVEEFTQLTAGTRDGDPEVAPAAPEPIEEAKPSETPRPDPKPSPQQSAAPAPTPPPPAPEPAPEPLRMAALPPDPEPVPAPRPEPAPAPAAAAEPEPAPAPQPTNVPVPRVKPKVATPAKPAQTARAPEPPRPEPQRPTPPEPERKFDADQIAALLNKVPDSGGAFESEMGATTASLGAPTGNQLNMSLSEIDALIRQIAQCWSPPAGILDAGQLLVRIGLDLNVDGSLAAPPRVLNSSYDPAFSVAAEAAMRAVNRCQPYSLPPEKFELWREIHVNFDPREILGG